MKDKNKAEIKALTLIALLIASFPGLLSSAGIVSDPTDANYSGKKGKTIYVSRLGDNSDGSSWKKAYCTIQAALSAIPDDKGGNVIIVRPDTYIEANLFPAFKGAKGAYNVIAGDYDGKAGSGAKGWVILDSGDPGKGFKSYDWWGNLKATSKGWSPQHTEETFSAIIWDRWILRNLYATGGDGGFMWDLTNQSGSEFSVIVEDCVTIGRAFGAGVAGSVCRADEPIIFRRTYMMCLDWWGDAGALYIRAHHTSPCDNYDVIVDDCTLVSPDNAIQGGNYGFMVYSRLKIQDSRLITLNFSQPVGMPSTGIINVKGKGEYLHIDFENCSMMGYKVFGVGDAQEKAVVPYNIKGNVQAYVQFQQTIPEGMKMSGTWPVELFNSIGKLRIIE